MTKANLSEVLYEIVDDEGHVLAMARFVATAGCMVYSHLRVMGSEKEVETTVPAFRCVWELKNKAMAEGIAHPGIYDAVGAIKLPPSFVP